MFNVEIKIYISCKYEDYRNFIYSEIKKNSNLGWLIVEKLELAQVVIAFDCLIDKRILNKQLYILIRQEPHSVLPEIYNIDLSQKPNLIIDVGRNSRESDANLPPPQAIKIEFIPGTKRNIDRSVVINSNLFSLHASELYSFRKKVVLKLPYVDLYGRGWNIGWLKKCKTILIELNKNYEYKKINIFNVLNYFKLPNSYKGELDLKSSVLVHYNSSIVIENEETYVSEKIFDCLNSGTIPIYVGGKLSMYNFPEDLVLIANADLKSINRCFDDSKKVDRKMWERRLISFLTSKDYIDYWSYNKFLSSINKEISKIYQ
jgi:hypothetical protein